MSGLFGRFRSAKNKPEPKPVDETKVTLAGTDQETLRCLSAGRGERYQRVVFTALLVSKTIDSIDVQSPDGAVLGYLPEDAVQQHRRTVLEYSQLGRPCCLAELQGSASGPRGFEVILDFSSLHLA